MKIWYLLNIGLIAVSCLTGCASPGAEEAARASSNAAAVVTMSGFKFDPQRVTIQAGQDVEWKNTAPIHHTVTADPSLARKSSDVALPEGAQPFNSGELKSGQSFRRTFTVPGTYRYFCIPHERFGMVGEVIVEPAATAP